MPRYPARQIITPDQCLNVLHITDLHLSRHACDAGVTTDPQTADRTTAPVVTTDLLAQDDGQHLNKQAPASACYQRFVAVIEQALNEPIRCDLILVTGDLVSEVDPMIYDRIFAVLTDTGVPFACIAGNHDVTDELGHDLPYHKRTLVARSADPRLLNRHRIDSAHWQLLLVDSSVAGQVAGHLAAEDIDWIVQQLQQCTKPAILAVHHHLLPVGSAWIDAHMTQNASALWQAIAPFDHLRAIVSGHNHQAHIRYCQNVAVYSTPSTCYQFKPFVDTFAYDDAAAPGYRWLQLAETGEQVSWVNRLTASR